MIDEQHERTMFEAEIGGPPYELSVQRYPNDARHAWPGNYCARDVDLAWCMWRARAELAARAEPASGGKA